MPNLNTLLDDHVLLKYESVDRIFLNGHQKLGSFVRVSPRKRA